MSTVLRPVGPQPSRVYWVRRLVVLGVLAVLLVVVIWALGSRGASEDGADDGSEQAAGDDVADGETAAGGPVACEAADLTVTLTSDARTYGPDANPVLAVTVKNTSEDPCTVDLGSGNRVVTVMSGADRIWSSADCGADEAERLLLLDPGAIDTAGVDWARERSDPECTAGLPAPRPGTYTAEVAVLGAESGTLVFELG